MPYYSCNDYDRNWRDYQMGTASARATMDADYRHLRDLGFGAQAERWRQDDMQRIAQRDALSSAYYTKTTYNTYTTSGADALYAAGRGLAAHAGNPHINGGRGVVNAAAVVQDPYLRDMRLWDMNKKESDRHFDRTQLNPAYFATQTSASRSQLEEKGLHHYTAFSRETTFPSITELRGTPSAFASSYRPAQPNYAQPAPPRYTLDLQTRYYPTPAPNYAPSSYAHQRLSTPVGTPSQSQIAYNAPQQRPAPAQVKLSDEALKQLADIQAKIQAVRTKETQASLAGYGSLPTRLNNGPQIG